MTDVSRAIQAISDAADKIGLPELARRADVPYTTVADWRAKGFRPKVVATFEKLSVAAGAVVAAADASDADRAA